MIKGFLIRRPLTCRKFAESVKNLPKVMPKPSREAPGDSVQCTWHNCVLRHTGHSPLLRKARQTCALVEQEMPSTRRIGQLLLLLFAECCGCGASEGNGGSRGKRGDRKPSKHREDIRGEDEYYDYGDVYYGGDYLYGGEYYEDGCYGDYEGGEYERKPPRKPPPPPPARKQNGKRWRAENKLC